MLEKTHDEEMAIDLWELISALKKRALIILAACLSAVLWQVYIQNFASPRCIRRHHRCDC